MKEIWSCDSKWTAAATLQDHTYDVQGHTHRIIRQECPGVTLMYWHNDVIIWAHFLDMSYIQVDLVFNVFTYALCCGVAPYPPKLKLQAAQPEWAQLNIVRKNVTWQNEFWFCAGEWDNWLLSAQPVLIGINAFVLTNQKQMWCDWQPSDYRRDSKRSPRDVDAQNIVTWKLLPLPSVGFNLE